MSTIGLDRIDPTDDPTVLTRVGGKAAGLAALLAAGLPVPPGFVVTTDAYRTVIADNQLAARIDDALAGPAPADAIAALFADAALPADLESSIVGAYRGLGDGDVAVAVRSSATAEDLPTASFAGQQDTFLGVRGSVSLLDAVRRCWASLWNEHAVAYRRRAGLEADVALAVVVQVLVDADAAGVLFTADPVTGRRDRIVVDATIGLGEALVGGLVTPDHAVLDASSLATLQVTVSDKIVATTRTTTGTTLTALPPDQRHRRVLSDAELTDLGRHGLAAASAVGCPVDVEWARAGGEFWIVQARPITALPPDPLGAEWSREMMIERYPDPVTPLTWSAVSDTFFASLDRVVRELGGQFPADVPLIRLVHGRIYINATAFSEGMASLPARPPVARTGSAPVARPRPWRMVRSLAAMVRLVLRTHREWDAKLPAFVTEMSRPLDVAALTDTGLVAQHRADGEFLAPMLDNHARSLVAGDLTLQLLTAITRSWLDDADGSLVLTLLSGMPGNQTLATNHGLWQLAQMARTSPALRDGIHRGLSLDALAELPDGGPFVVAVGGFLQAYGHRSPRYELRHPCWREDPDQLLDLIRLQLQGPSPDPLDGQRSAERAREAATAAARTRLGTAKRLVFDKVLDLAQSYFRLRENQQFHLVLGSPRLRAILGEVGRRAVARGTLTQADDVFFLHTADLSLPLSAEAATDGRALRTTVAEGREAFVRAQATTAPLRFGGSEPAATPSPGEDDAVQRGVAASPGRAIGVARRVTGPADFASVQPGDIIVAPATTSAWTPLFGVAAGLVTEHGGLLSHSGVVAREYGLPAVLGVPDALSRIADGDLLELDGSAGTVRISRP